MTKSEIETLAPGTALYDELIGGLHVRCYPSGKKPFFYFYRTRAGRQRRPKIGEWPGIDIAEARERARALQARVVVGEDPKGDWENFSNELTLTQLFQKAWSEHWCKDRFKSSGWANEVRRLWEKNVEPTFGGERLSEVKVSAIRRWHKGFADAAPYTGNRALDVFSKIFSFAQEEELFPMGANPCSLVKAHPEKKRKRFASEEEVRRIAPIMAREAEDYPYGITFLYLLIFSGARPSAIENARQENLVRFEYEGQTYGALTLRGKMSAETGDEETVILPPQAMQVIDKLVPPKDGTITGIGMPRHLWDRIRTEAQCEDLWARDWRRAFASYGLSSGISMDTLAEVLSHRSTQTTKVYARLLQEDKMKASATIAQVISKLMEEGVARAKEQKQPLNETTTDRTEALLPVPQCRLDDALV